MASRPPLWPCVVAVVAPLVLLLAPAVGGLLPLGWDAVLFFAPLLRLAGELLRQGQLPLWTSALGTGYPLLASTQAWLLYPPAWPMLLWPDPTSALTMFLLLHVMWGGVGGVMLARAVRLGPAAAATVGVLCGASLPMTGLFNRPELVCALAWAPWVYAAALASRGDVVRRARLGGLALGFNAVVSPQMALLHGCVGAGLWLWRRPSRAEARGWGGAGLWFLLVAAPTWLPFLELLPWTDRAGGVDASQQLGFGLPAVQLLQAVGPTLLQLTPWGMDPPGNAAVPYAHLLWVASPWSGPLAVALGLAGMRLHRLRGVAVMTVTLLLLATPDVVPGVAGLWGLPPLNLMRFPAKAWEAGWPLWALLVGGAVEVVARARRRGGFVAAPVLVLSAVTAGLLALSTQRWAALVDALTTDAHLLGSLPQHAPVALSLTLLWCAVALAGLAGRWRHAGTALAAVLCAESIWLGSTGAVFAALPAPQDAPVAQAIRTHAGAPVRVLNFWNAANPVLAQPLEGPASRAQRMQAEARHGGGNALLGQGLALEQAFMGIRLRGPQQVAQALVNAPGRRMAALGSTALLLGTDFPQVGTMTTVQQWPAAGVSLRVPSTTAARVHVARRVLVVAGGTTLAQTLTAPGVDPAQDAVVLSPLELPGSPAANAVMEADTARLVRFNVDTPQQTLVWTADALGPGWDVTVDGAPAQAVAVHGALRGVVVPAGRHVVAWEHSAGALWGGLLVSLLCAVWLWLRGRAGLNHPPAASQYPSPGR